MDPNYAHQYDPRRKDGKCKFLLKYGSCALGADAPVHVRWREKREAEALKAPPMIAMTPERIARLDVSTENVIVPHALLEMVDEVQAMLAEARGERT